VTINSSIDLTAMRAVGRLVAETLTAMQAAVRPGVTTGDLDRVAEHFARARGARSAPQLDYAFPGFTCISVNDQIVHGIPGPRRILPGDVVKLDVTLELDGYMADSARTVLVPPVSPEGRRLRACARAACHRAIEVACAGHRVSEIGRTVEAETRRSGFAVIRELTGHGIGRRIHEEPAVPNYADPRANAMLVEGLVLAIEPMITTRPARVVEEPDGWTLRTHDRSLVVHHEHTVVIRRGVPLVLTAA
jgi:methionyl aminopeptidase